MKSNLTEQFLDILYEMSTSEMPENILDKAKSCLADYLAVTIGGSYINKEKNDKFISTLPKGEKLVIGTLSLVPFHSALLMNAFNSHILELDDGHRVSTTHIEAPVFSALLTVAQNRDFAIKDILKASVVGYEATVRLGICIQPSHKKKGFHVTGTCATVGCAMAVATLLKYSKDEMRNALSASATSGAGLLEVMNGKSEQKPYNVANAVVSGVNAALYGKYFAPPEDILGGARGFINDFSSEHKEEALTSPVTSYAIEGIYMKPYAACRHCHAPMEGALKLAAIKKYDLSEIKEIKIQTYDLAVYGHDHTEIDGPNSAKMSIPYSVAVAYLKGKSGMEAFTKEAIKDSGVLSLTKKVRVYEDDELSALVPQKRASIVTLVCKNGKTETVRVDYPKGEPENPISKDEMTEKFYSLTEFAGAKKDSAKKLFDLIYKENSTLSELYEILKNLF